MSLAHWFLLETCLVIQKRMSGVYKPMRMVRESGAFANCKVVEHEEGTEVLELVGPY